MDKPKTPNRVASSEIVRCAWCGKPRKSWSDWEQRNVTSGQYNRLCSPCLHRRQMNPYNALLDMRKVAPNDQAHL